MNAQLNDPTNDRRSVDPLTGETHARASFADEVRGTAPMAIDMTMARLAQDVYRSDDRGRAGVAGWTPLTDEQFRRVGIDPTLRSSDASGFDADIYTDGQGRYALAFRGTDAGKDWATNLGQGLGFETAQYNQAIALSRQAKMAFGEELVITGHSLGGGLAAVGALVADTPAVTFNAAGVKDRTLERVGLDADAVKEEATHGQIRRYAVDNEILTGLQERNLATRYLMPDAVGHKIELPDPDPLSFWQNLNPVKSIKHGIEMHSMDSVIRAQEQAFGRTLGADAPMSHIAHPLHAQYQRNFDQLQPELQQRGMDTREAQNVAGAVTLAAHREGLAPDRIAIGANGDRVFAVQGDQAESQRYAQVDLQQGARTPLAESSRESAAWVAAQPQGRQADPQQLNPQANPQQPDPAQDQAAPGRGR